MYVGTSFEKVWVGGRNGKLLQFSGLARKICNNLIFVCMHVSLKS